MFMERCDRLINSYGRLERSCDQILACPSKRCRVSVLLYVCCGAEMFCNKYALAYGILLYRIL